MYECLGGETGAGRGFGAGMEMGVEMGGLVRSMLCVW